MSHPFRDPPAIASLPKQPRVVQFGEIFRAVESSFTSRTGNEVPCWIIEQKRTDALGRDAWIKIEKAYKKPEPKKNDLPPHPALAEQEPLRVLRDLLFHLLERS